MVAIIVPTMNRSCFIKRLSRFYSNYAAEYTIYIADSSNEEYHIKETKKVIKSLACSINIKYGYYPDTNIEEAKRLILNQVTQKYAAYCGDDDFLIPDTLKKCAEFLELNPDYSNCHGTGMRLKMKDDSLYGYIEAVSEYKLLGNEFDDPYTRVGVYLNDYWPIWTVRRVDEFRKTLKLLKNIPVESFREITMGCVPIIQGKTKLINNLYVVRQVHKNRFQNPSLIEAFLLGDWYASYKEMNGILENEVGKKTALDKSKLHETVKQGFVSYYKAGLESQICKKNPTFLRGLKKIIKQYFPYVMLIRASLMIRNQKPEYYDDFYKVMNFLRKE